MTPFPDNNVIVSENGKECQDAMQNAIREVATSLHGWRQQGYVIFRATRQNSIFTVAGEKTA
jgi:hypothetical protein